MNGRSQPTLHPNALHFRGLLSATKLLWEMWWFLLPHSFISVIKLHWLSCKGWTNAPQGCAEVTPHGLSREGLWGAVSWPHVSKLCPSNYTMTKKAPAWLLNKQNPKSPTGSTLWQLSRGSTALFPGLASVSKHLFPLTHPGYILGRYCK